MYDLVEDPRDIPDIDSWLAFEDRERFDPIDDGWITVYRTGCKTTGVGSDVVDQGFSIHCFLVDQEELDAFSGIDPYGEILEFDFYPMAYGSRRGEEYWEENLTQCIDGIEAKRFVMKFTKDAPLVDTGFVEYHKLVERDKRNFERYDTDEKVVRFPADKWDYLSSQSDHGGLDDTILSLEVRASFLKDYLQERGCALVLAYFQSRDVNLQRKMFNSLTRIEKASEYWAVKQPVVSEERCRATNYTGFALFIPPIFLTAMKKRFGNQERI